MPGFPYGASHCLELPYLFTMGAAAPTAPQRALSEPRFGPADSVLSPAPGPGGTHPVDGPAEHHCAFWNALGV
ncbi:hypothetical protein [Streptomyces sp. NPDC051109]|uniref:hypothetical protein n=1 Tax=Streptomyces sp. NPDC051109 TaxID=3365642 RepID=UPI00378BDC34